MAKPRHAVELKASVGAASFMSGDKAIELTDDSPVFETDDPSEHAQLLELPFLKDAEPKPKAAKSEEAA
jgi:hypothetical protein